MVELYNEATGAAVGTITDAQFRFLMNELEEESLEDRDYYISRDTIEMLAQDGADAALLATLRQALGPREGAELRWRRI
ncbi:MAG TPA: hypothetical protein VF166_15280 [Gemmatimonadaceae bacterium]